MKRLKIGSDLWRMSIGKVEGGRSSMIVVGSVELRAGGKGRRQGRRSIE
jgi:hypothetical protein